MKKFKSKKIKKITKKRKLFKLLILIMIIYLFSYLSFNYLDNKINYVSNSNFFNIILKLSNFNSEKDNNINLLKDTIKKITKVDFTYPISILDEGIKNNTVTVSNTSDIDDYNNYTKLEHVTKTIDNNTNDVTNPIIYLYNSHQLETYKDNIGNVMEVSYKLQNKLKDYNINSIVENQDIQEILRINNWQGSAAYKASRILINDAISNYKSLKYFIDIHRDSVGYNYTTLTTDNKTYAKLYFVVGLEHENYEKNLSLATTISDMINKKVPKLSKGILAKKGENVNGIYNQDVNGNVLLIEFGGVDNTIEEVSNTVDILSQVLSEYIKGDTNASK